MKTFYSIATLAFLGLVIALINIFYTQDAQKVDTKPILNMQVPFKSYVAGSGIIEAQSTNIPIGSTLSGVITKVYVKVGENVKAGDPLFSIDDNMKQSELLVANASLKVAKTYLKKATDQFKIMNSMKKNSPGLISDKIYIASKDDVSNANSNVEFALSKIKKIKKDLKLCTIYSSIDARILVCKIRTGQYFDSTNPSESKLILGSKAMSLRVDINEYDAWRIKPHTKAIAYIRGHPELKIPLQFSYIEPYIIPKKILTGLSTERTDTRVLQIIYDFKKPSFAVYVGQQLDLFIED